MAVAVETYGLGQSSMRCDAVWLCAMGDMTGWVILFAIALICVGLVFLVKYIIEL